MKVAEGAKFPRMKLKNSCGLAEPHKIDLSCIPFLRGMLEIK